MKKRILLLCALSQTGLSHATTNTIPVPLLTVAPKVDGSLDEWGALDQTAWIGIKTKNSNMEEDDEDSRADMWRPELQVMAGVFENKLYLAARWRDESQNIIYKPWKKNGVKYTRSNRKDDMFAVRFELRGDFDACMISGKSYQVDLWLWSAGRSNLAGMADDMFHQYAKTPLDPALEFPTRNGVVYIQKQMDPGEGGWSYTKAPAKSVEEVVPSVTVQGHPEGSRADVTAMGRWQDGSWTLEMARSLRTADSNDVIFSPGGQITGQLAVFNAEYNMMKKVSPKLTFDFSQIK